MAAYDDTGTVTGSRVPTGLLVQEFKHSVDAKTSAGTAVPKATIHSFTGGNLIHIALSDVPAT